MQITIKPRNIPISEIDIRIDQADIEHGMEITYDLVISDSTTEDLFNQVDLAADKTKPGQKRIITGQVQGHHFSSSWTTDKLGVGSLKDIFETFNKKFTANAARASQ